MSKLCLARDAKKNPIDSKPEMLRARAGRLARRVRLSRKNGLISQHRRYSVIDAMDIHPDIKSPPPLDMQGEPYALAAAIEGAGLRCFCAHCISQPCSTKNERCCHVL